MIYRDFLTRNKIPILFVIIIFIRKIIDSKLFVGIVLGYILCYGMDNMNVFSSIINKSGDRNEITPNSGDNLMYINSDIKLKRAFIDIRRYEGLNYVAINKALNHMERFLQIRNNFRNIDNTTQFYSLARMERKKALTSLKSLLLKSRVRERKKIIRIIKYIAKVSKKYLFELAQINNDRWNKEYTTSDISPIYVENLSGYN
tara:strand:+ start:38 stop:643 length:606 start_codon:yes stop_codon:yes gene_type:complete